MVIALAIVLACGNSPFNEPVSAYHCAVPPVCFHGDSSSDTFPECAEGQIATRCYWFEADSSGLTRGPHPTRWYCLEPCYLDGYIAGCEQQEPACALEIDEALGIADAYCGYASPRSNKEDQ
jgi:hypothetical protein